MRAGSVQPVHDLGQQTHIAGPASRQIAFVRHVAAGAKDRRHPQRRGRFQSLPQPSARRQTAPCDGGTRASRAQHAMHQHDPDNMNGSRLARSLLCQQLVRRYRPSAGGPFQAIIRQFPRRVRPNRDTVQLFTSASRVRKCGGGHAVRPFGRTAEPGRLGRRRHACCPALLATLARLARSSRPGGRFRPPCRACARPQPNQSHSQNL